MCVDMGIVKWKERILGIHKSTGMHKSAAVGVGMLYLQKLFNSLPLARGWGCNLNSLRA